VTNPLTVLMTCGTGPGVVGHIDALRHNTYAPVRVVVGDVAADPNAGFALADGHVAWPSAHDPGLIDTMLEICDRHRVDVLWPVFDGELEPLVASRRRFEVRGIRPLLADEETVRTCLDKAAFHHRLMGTETVLPFRTVGSSEELRAAALAFGYPDHRVVIKPTRAAGGRGFHVLDARQNGYDRFFSERPDATFCTLDMAMEAMSRRSDANGQFLLVMPFIDGPEYGCDMVADKGRLLAAVTRAKYPPLHEGMHTRIVVGEDGKVLHVAERVIGSLRADGLLSMDLRADRDGRLWVLEINPRAGAYLGMACRRIDLMGLALAKLFGDRPEVGRFRRSSDDTVGLRYWSDMVLVDNRPRILGGG